MCVANKKKENIKLKNDCMQLHKNHYSKSNKIKKNEICSKYCVHLIAFFLSKIHKQKCYSATYKIRKVAIPIICPLLRKHHTPDTNVILCDIKNEHKKLCTLLQK